MTIGKKLTVYFGAMAALLLVLSAASLKITGDSFERFDTAANQTVAKVLLADRIYKAESDMLSSQRAMLLYTYGKNNAMIEASLQRFREYSAITTKALEEMRPLLADGEGKRVLDDAKRTHQELVGAAVEAEQLCAAGNADGALALARTKLVPLYENLGRDAERLTELEMAQLNVDRQAGASQKTTGTWLTALLAMIGMCLAGVALFAVKRSFQALQRLVAGVADGAGQLASAAAQVSTSSQGLAQGASEQAATLEETSSSSEEINSMVRKNAENSRDAAHLMDAASSAVEEANRKLDQMVVSMKDINASSDRISKIIKVIDEIAFQTNILALNAAVEAARAGEAGMGFAVVADEVRNLAQRCAQAAKDTAALIEDSIAKSGEGGARLNEVAGSIRSITDNANKVKTLVDEVSLGSQEQSRGIEQVANAIAQMEQVTQKNAANAEEGASAGEELSAQSETLRQIVGELAALVGGGEAEGRRIHGKRKAPGAGLREPARFHAVSPKPSNRVVDRSAATSVAEPAPAPAAPARDSFPLDEQFKEF